MLAAKTKTVADPSDTYESLSPLWKKCRAVCSGEQYVKELDKIVSLNNMLIPFSPSMSQDQYSFFLAEAEFPGITSEFAKMLVGGLLRKKPTVTLPDKAPADAHEWIVNHFGQDESTLVAFLDDILWEEVQTQYSWIYIDFPAVENYDDLDLEARKALKPFPVTWQAESVINVKVSGKKTGSEVLERVILRGLVETYEDEDSFHPEYVDTVWVHEIDPSGYYQIRIFEKEASTPDPKLVSGQRDNNIGEHKETFKEVDKVTNIKMSGKRLTFIPAWPVSGQLLPDEPPLLNIIDKEISLYNKISRRNHLLYGAATYTPVIFSDMGPEDFDEIVEAGLGTWIHLSSDDRAEILKTPTEALADMDTTIKSTIEEMAKLGIRMLTPETAQSGIALQLRNAAQTAKLGSLNNRISSTMQQIIAFMLNWRYGTDIKDSEIEFELTADFDALPVGDDWIRLVTEWYENGLIPRSLWLSISKHNDIIPTEYNDDDGRKEINEDEIIMKKESELQDYASLIKSKEDPVGE